MVSSLRVLPAIVNPSQPPLSRRAYRPDGGDTAAGTGPIESNIPETGPEFPCTDIDPANRLSGEMSEALGMSLDRAPHAHYVAAANLFYFGKRITAVEQSPDQCRVGRYVFEPLG